MIVAADVAAPAAAVGVVVEECQQAAAARVELEEADVVLVVLFH